MEAIVTGNSLMPTSETPLLVVHKFEKITLAYWYIETRWKKILKKKNNPRVQQFLALLYDNDIEPRQFCFAMGNFFLFGPSIRFGAPPLTEFKPEELKSALYQDFGSARDLTLQLTCVTEILMKSVWSRRRRRRRNSLLE